ncbi:hypothetical protein [Alkalibacter saccharofermentans]|uniref:Uncharacterized protein n=1 Tax=Alkalibacter saccharofermentans DSM 14828 TaxID=1120975 RepID=A0A1M4ZIP7_9FIRM|nr:hypothetical protein [Alkalibacter saccharofermentans]SHF17672.1 hypothetical protein SAMN02746064_02057 [Alkalibacter saccharofermentans DSM 14828]
MKKQLTETEKELIYQIESLKAMDAFKTITGSTEEAEKEIGYLEAVIEQLYESADALLIEKGYTDDEAEELIESLKKINNGVPLGFIPNWISGGMNLDGVELFSEQTDDNKLELTFMFKESGNELSKFIITKVIE